MLYWQQRANHDRYAVVSSPNTLKQAVMKSSEILETLWQKDKVVWTEGLENVFSTKGPKIKDCLTVNRMLTVNQT